MTTITDENERDDEIGTRSCRTVGDIAAQWAREQETRYGPLRRDVEKVWAEEKERRSGS